MGGQEKEWMGCFLDELRSFGINADQRTTGMVKGGGITGGAFHGEMDHCR